MQYLHIKNLEKYHPGYKDRNLLWCKAYFTMISGDPEFEMIDNEIDKWRFISLVILELQAKKPIPLNDDYLKKKGFDLRKRPISLTLQVLHNFVSIDTEEKQSPCIEVEKIRSREDSVTVTDFFNFFNLKTKKNFKLTPANKELIIKRLNDGFTLEQLKAAVDNFILDDWPDRHKHLDLVYCIGIRNKIDNLDKWLNLKPKQEAVRRVL